MGHLRVTIGYLRATMGYHRVLKISHLKVFVKLRQGSGKDGQGMALNGKGLKACLELTLKLVATTTNTWTLTWVNFTQLMARWGSGGLD